MLAESAAEGTAAAEEASRVATAADSDDAAELYRKAQQMLAASTLLQQAVQRSTDNLDTITSCAAQIYTSVLEDSAEQSEQTAEDPDCSDNQESSPYSLENSRSPLLYNACALQLWLLKCCQASKGGMRDKPGKPPDYYHTCYCLSGLSSSQHFGGFVLGSPSNKLVKADPLCNVVESRLTEALEYQSRC